MALLVDSSVWIDFFNGVMNPQTDFLNENVGGRMIGTSAAYVTTNWLAPMMSAPLPYHKIATAAALMALLVYGIGFITSFFLPEPKQQLAE